jgi:hypothetical protein
MNSIKNCQNCGMYLQLPIDDFEHEQNRNVCDHGNLNGNFIVLVCPKCRHGNY